MTLEFLHNGVFEVLFDRSTVLRGTTFAVTTSLGGVQLSFVFKWDRHNRYYSVDIIDADDQIIEQWALTMPVHTKVLRGLAPNSTDNPDMLLSMYDVTYAGDEAPRPKTLGTKHRLFISRGKLQ